MEKRYCYGVTEDKYVPKEEDKKKARDVKPLETYRFHLDPLLRGKSKLKRGQAAIQYRVTPDTLVQLCAEVVDKIPMPKVHKWKVTDVADWIRKLGFPEYQNTFKKNFIHGRSLVRMDASYLVKINIKDFDHILIITKSIRKLYGFERSYFSRSISLPDRYPRAAYKFFRVRNGPKYELTRRTDLFRRRHQLRPKPLYETHWQRLERWLKHMRPTEVELIGSSKPRKNMLYYPPKRSEAEAQPKKPAFVCTGLPPCMDNWNFKPPWILKCLNRKPKVELEPHFCRCHGICTCGWPTELNEKGFTLLVKKVPHKYSLVDPRSSSISSPIVRLSKYTN